jgi:5-methylcytosine-specific restriction enzyme A
MDIAKLYKTKRWKRLRRHQLALRPYCQCPHHDGQQVTADTVDHIRPHRGDLRLFWDQRNLQSMTKECHDRWKQSLEKGGHGFMKGCDESGAPLSKDHHWYG